MSTLSSSGADSGTYDQLDRLADEFAERFRRGERPNLKEYVDRYPLPGRRDSRPLPRDGRPGTG